VKEICDRCYIFRYEQITGNVRTTSKTTKAVFGNPQLAHSPCGAAEAAASGSQTCPACLALGVVCTFSRGTRLSDNDFKNDLVRALMLNPVDETHPEVVPEPKQAGRL